MDPDPATALVKNPELLISRVEQDGTHSGHELTRDVRRGRRVRLRRGAYVDAKAWLDCYPSERFQWMVAATAAQLQAPRFCRETALMLHGVSLVAPPAKVQVRAPSRSAARSVPQPSMTGKLPGSQFLKAAQGHLGERHDPLPRGALTGFGTRFVSPSGIPDGVTIEQRRLLGYPAAVEPLALVLADTVSRMPFDRGVVALDSALRGSEDRPGVGLDQLAAAESELGWSKTRRFAWQSALAFADPQSESVGESVSRVRISELGFVAPKLQSVVEVDGTVYRLDFCWEDAGVVGEFDGWMKYRAQGHDALRQEKIREDAIRSTGRQVVRWYWEDLQSPESMRRKLTRAGVPRRSA